MGYKVLGLTEELFRGYEPREGLEGPFIFENLRVVYYDPREGAYLDPKTDFYMSREEAENLRRN